MKISDLMGWTAFAGGVLALVVACNQPDIEAMYGKPADIWTARIANGQMQSKDQLIKEYNELRQAAIKNGTIPRPIMPASWLGPPQRVD